MFKLLEIEFKGHLFFHSMTVSFVDDGEENVENYTTLIIGPNGTGKSKILLAIIQIFNSLELLKQNPNKKYSLEFHYIIKFSKDGKIHKVDYSTNELFFDDINMKDGIDIIDLPSKVLVSAFSFNDKYPLREQRGRVVNKNYYYLGLKSTSNNIFLGNPAKNAISNLLNAIEKDKDLMPLQEAFNILKLRPRISLVFKPGKHFKFLLQNEFWDNNFVSPDEFVSTFNRFVINKTTDSSTPETKRLGNEKIERILKNKEKNQIIFDFLKENIREITYREGSFIALNPVWDLQKRESYWLFTEQAIPMQLLCDLELISFERFDIENLETSFPFDEASSGEYHIILSFLNILSLIEENSLVLIDEPEISLHPNWQIKYMNIFKEIFCHFPHSHFILASHSHFLVSDLKKENSNIVALNYNKKGLIEQIPIEKNTYGWSSEQILLDVFKVASTRNYFITKTITDVLKELSLLEPDFTKVKLKLEEIIFLNISDFNEHDPMKEIFSKLTQLYNEI